MLHRLYATSFGWDSILVWSYAAENVRLVVAFCLSIFLVYFHHRLRSSIHVKAFNHAAIGMALISLDGSWLKVNSSLCRMLGFSESELLAKTLQAVTRSKNWEHDLANIQVVLEGKQKIYHVEKCFYCKNGNPTWVLLSISLVRHPKGHPLYFISQVQDVTEDKTTEHWIADRMISLTAQLHSEIDELKSQGTYNPSTKIEKILAEMEFFSANS